MTPVKTATPVVPFLAELVRNSNPLLTYLSPYTVDMTNLWNTLADGLSKGDVMGNWLPFSITVDSRTTSGMSGPGLARCGYPAPNTSYKLTSSAGGVSGPMKLRRTKGDKLPLDRRVPQGPPLRHRHRHPAGDRRAVLRRGQAPRHSDRPGVPGNTVQAQFDRTYLLRVDQTKVKVSGVPVGVVSGLKHDAQGAMVSMKIFGNNAARLGTAPSAQLRIESLLGGINYVQLTPGGGPGRPHQTIPLAPHHHPVCTWTRSSPRSRPRRRKVRRSSSTKSRPR